jgi:subtilase family serine protease
MRLSLIWAIIATAAASPVLAAAPTTAPLVTGVVNDQQRTILSGNHASATAVAKDMGAADSAHVFQHVTLQLKRSPAMQAAFDRLVSDQQTRGNPNFHRWLSSADLRHFGPAQSDINRVTTWLRSKGVTVNAQSPSGMTLDISGRASILSAAFGTELHVYQLRGETHFANTRDVSIPSALRPVVGGVMLSNFFPRSNAVRGTNFTIPVGKGKLPFYAVAPSDFIGIYNVTPMLGSDNGFRQAFSGAGVTIAVLEDSDMLPQDWETFRQAFAIDVPNNGFASYHGHLISLHPGHCTPAGRNGDELEAALDTEWASVSAPDANIVEASCASTETTFGVATALSALVEGKQTDATIYSISYGGCEQENGLAFLSNWSNLAEEAAAEGISIVVSSGDSGSSCDRSTVDSNGIGVNGLASNPFVVSVGGTDFSDAVDGKTAQYWNKANNPNNLYSARSYIPEVPWDNSCANSIIAQLGSKGSSPMAYCNSNPTVGESGVGATGGPSLFYSKPAWQAKALLGMPNDGVRDQPDVVSFASNGILDHATLICFSDKNNGGFPCRYSGTIGGGPVAETQLVGGTSVAAPAFAGILALLTEVQQQKLGNPAPRLYELAAMQYSNPVLVKSCNASLGFNVSKGCIFNNVTRGDIAEPCFGGTPDCHVTAESTQNIGILSAQDGHSATPAFLANPGYSMAAGLGSVNVTNLIYNY